MYATILFDLDGTLTDPKPGITKCVQYALAKLGITVENADTLVPFIGPPLATSFKEYYQLSDEQIEQAIVYYRERFTTVGLYENAVFPGIADMLSHLQQAGKRLVVATSKPTEFSVTILKHFKLYSYFQLVAGSNLDGTRLEKAEVIAYALSQLQEPERQGILMVGDRKHDIIGARENGVAVAAVSYGYGSIEELRRVQPDVIVASVEELTRFLLHA